MAKTSLPNAPSKKTGHKSGPKRSNNPPASKTPTPTPKQKDK